MRVLVHHHARIFKKDDGYYTQSFIGYWLNEISRNVDFLCYAAHTSSNKDEKYDVRLDLDNSFIIHSFGASESFSRFNRNLRIIREIRKISLKYDVLIVRGITPRQFLLWQSSNTVLRFFLLVGSISDSRRSIADRSLFIRLHFQLRILEMSLMAKNRNCRFLANSPGICRELKAEYDIDSKYCPTNTLSSSLILEQPVFRKEIVNILYCGRIVRDKGILELIGAINILRHRGLEFKLTLVGSVDKNLQNEEDFVKLTKANENVFFAGFVPFGPELLKFYKSADLFVLPSYHEGFPHSLWEATSQGVPIVTTAVGGIPSILNHSCVKFIEVKSSSSIVDAILELKNEGVERRKSMVSKSRKQLERSTLEESVRILLEEIEFELR